MIHTPTFEDWQRCPFIQAAFYAMYETLAQGALKRGEFGGYIHDTTSARQKQHRLAGFRHACSAHQFPEGTDRESGLPHVNHAATRYLLLLGAREMEKKRSEIC